jgi:hypothetical protein
MNLRTLIRLTVVALLGAATALLVSCGSTGKGLIPATKAGPLQEDFEAVAQAASAGNGDCTATEKALGKTEQDFLALPVTVDAGLHKLLEEGIENLRKRALSMCIQPTGGATGTTSTTTSTTPPANRTSTTETPTTPTTTPTTPSTTPTGAQTTPTSPSTSGGTEAGGEAGGEHGTGAGAEAGAGAGAGAGQENGGSNVGGASPGGGQ